MADRFKIADLLNKSSNGTVDDGPQETEAKEVQPQKAPTGDGPKVKLHKATFEVEQPRFSGWKMFLAGASGDPDQPQTLRELIATAVDEYIERQSRD